jgi:hypothetical protein
MYGVIILNLLDLVLSQVINLTLSHLSNIQNYAVKSTQLLYTNNDIVMN